MPILAQAGTTLGTLACYYRQPRTPEHCDLTLIERATHLAGIAIEHHRTQAELYIAEKRYRTLVERLPAITYMAEVGTEGQWHFVSPQIEAMLGFTVEEWLADRGLWIRSIHEDDREIALAAEKRIQNTGELYQAEYRMRARVTTVRFGAIGSSTISAQPLAKSASASLIQSSRPKAERQCRIRRSPLKM